MFSGNFLLGASTFHCLCKSINFHPKLKLARIFKFETIGDLWFARGGGLAALYLRPDILEIRLENHPYISWNEREKLWSVFMSGCHENTGWLHWKKEKPSWLIPLNFLCFELFLYISFSPHTPRVTATHQCPPDLVQLGGLYGVWDVCMAKVLNPKKTIY